MTKKSEKLKAKVPYQQNFKETWLIRYFLWTITLKIITYNHNFYMISIWFNMAQCIKVMLSIDLIYIQSILHLVYPYLWHFVKWSLPRSRSSWLKGLKSCWYFNFSLMYKCIMQWPILFRWCNHGFLDYIV